MFQFPCNRDNTMLQCCQRSHGEFKGRLRSYVKIYLQDSLVARNIGVINKLKSFLPAQALSMWYCAINLPYLNYEILAWEIPLTRDSTKSF